MKTTNPTPLAPLATGAQGRIAQNTFIQGPVSGQIEGMILNALLSGVLKYATGKGLGWFVGAVGGDGTSNQDTEILKELAEIQQTLNAILTEEQQIANFLTTLEEELSFEILAASIKDAAAGIKSTFDAAVNLTPKDKESAAKIISDSINPEWIPRQITIISNAVLGDETTASLIKQWSVLIAGKSVQGPYDPRNVGPGSALDTRYLAIEQYFRYLVSLQIKGIILEVNGFHAQNDPNSAKRKLDQRLGDLLQQNLQFLGAVEGFAVNYCYDLTLLGLITGQYGKRLAVPWNPANLTDPIFRADQYLANNNPWEEKTLRVRVWGGRGSSGDRQHAFDTGNFSGTDPKRELSLVDPSGKKTPIFDKNSNSGSYLLFPQRNGAQWELTRYSFRDLTEAVGSRMINPKPSATAAWNAYMSWRSFHRYTAEPIQFTFVDPGGVKRPRAIRDPSGKYLYTALDGVPGYLNVALTQTKNFGFDPASAIVPPSPEFRIVGGRMRVTDSASKSPYIETIKWGRVTAIEHMFGHAYAFSVPYPEGYAYMSFFFEPILDTTTTALAVVGGRMQVTNSSSKEPFLETLTWGRKTALEQVVGNARCQSEQYGRDSYCYISVYLEDTAQPVGVTAGQIRMTNLTSTAPFVDSELWGEKTCAEIAIGNAKSYSPLYDGYGYFSLFTAD